MSQPYGFTHRHDPGLRGVVARWWVAHRTRVIRRRLARLRSPEPPQIIS